MSVKYPNVLKEIEELEKVTYFHDDNAQDVYDSIMEVVKAAKPKDERIEHEVIFKTLDLLKKVHYEDSETDEDEYSELSEDDCMTEKELQAYIERVEFEAFLKGTKIEAIRFGNDVYVYEDGERILITEIV